MGKVRWNKQAEPFLHLPWPKQALSHCEKYFFLPLAVLFHENTVTNGSGDTGSVEMLSHEPSF